MRRHANAIWHGTLKEGNGTLTTQSNALTDVNYTFKGRFVDKKGTESTNPEELIAAAHIGCFCMQLANLLAENGTPAEKLDGRSFVTLEQASNSGYFIRSSNLQVWGIVPGLEYEKFLKIAEEAKSTCPVSQALGGVEITLEANLESSSGTDIEGRGAAQSA